MDTPIKKIKEERGRFPFFMGIQIYPSLVKRRHPSSEE
jgi:hypothetical protein